jgi:hypothetical protein
MLSTNVRFCEGFRMPALDRGMFPRPEAAGFRKRPKEETAARKRLDVAGAIYGDLRTARFEIDLASHAEESHLRVLPEPCMNLSTHTAPDVRPLPTSRLEVSNGFALSICHRFESLGVMHMPCVLSYRLLPLPVGPWPQLNNAALRSSPITEPSSLLGIAPPLCPASVL